MGKRYGTFVIMYIGCKKTSGVEVSEKTEKMGFECDVPELKQFVKKYVNEHNLTQNSKLRLGNGSGKADD